MDPRRLLTFACAGLALCGCTSLRRTLGLGPATTVAAPVTTSSAAAPQSTVPPPAVLEFASMAPIPNPPERYRGRRAQGRVRDVRAEAGAGAAAGSANASVRLRQGRTAIAAANVQAREASTSEAFVGGMQVFSYEPGRVYEIWTAPLRVTTLTLAPGETLISKAAGDTVRWQIGETTSGQGSTARAHVMIKPLERGLETNLVLATSQRVYLVELKSGSPEAFNTAVSWDLGAAVQVADATGAASAAEPSPAPVGPAGPLDARFRINARGHRPDWTPTAVMTDGVRTFMAFPGGLGAHEAPGLFVLGEDGKAQFVNYRQQDGLWVIDRVFDRAELRLGDKHPKVVRITREGGRS